MRSTQTILGYVKAKTSSCSSYKFLFTYEIRSYEKRNFENFKTKTSLLTIQN